ncbi:hypothetical protein VTN96DRAFT_5028 [Rasamsonia emersonii]
MMGNGTPPGWCERGWNPSDSKLPSKPSLIGVKGPCIGTLDFYWADVQIPMPSMQTHHCDARAPSWPISLSAPDSAGAHDSIPASAVPACSPFHSSESSQSAD